MILQDKTVLVSGVGAGLGGEVARLAVRDGANVVMGARTESRLKEMAGQLDPMLIGDGSYTPFRSYEEGDDEAVVRSLDSPLE